MKVYQCIHKYPPHIPLFEKKYGITDASKLSFTELQTLIINDGYASSYILKPALEHKPNEVFFTIWNYERLQRLWAIENGLHTNDLTEIKLAQLEWFNPDVFYNHSPFNDNKFIELVKLKGIKCKTICWNGIIEPRPLTYPLYDAHLTLHRPYVDYWNRMGLKAHELQPGIPNQWNYNNSNRNNDLLFYGQYVEILRNNMFSARNELLKKIIKYKKSTNHKIKISLQYKIKKKTALKIGKISLGVPYFPPRLVRFNSDEPLYGASLYQEILNSKIVMNAFTDYNIDYKSNMRIYESIGHGAFLISERGNYPDEIVPDTDFYTYEGFDELKEKIEYVLENWSQHQIIAENVAKKIRKIYSKEKQWERFQKIVASL